MMNLVRVNPADQLWRGFVLDVGITSEDEDKGSAAMSAFIPASI